MKKLYILLITTMLSAFIYAQDSLTIRGRITSGNNAIPSSTIYLHRAPDSGIVKIEISNAAGEYEFTRIPAGKYFLVASTTGYAEKSIPAFDLQSNLVMDPVELEPESKSLTGVTVQAKRPMVEAKLDKTLINVDASPSNASLNALDLLGKSPGITVDRDGNISLKGKQGVMVLLDGKQTYLSGTELANLLRSMPASQLEQIEIMTQPSARFDAAGNSGVINLKTKKNKQMGINGSVNLSFMYGKYSKSPNSFTLNYRKKNTNIYLNGGYSYWSQRTEQTLTRTFEQPGIISKFDQGGGQTNISNNYNLRAGIDYKLDSTTSIGLSVGGNYSLRNGKASSIGNFYDNNDRIPDSTVTANNYTRAPWQSFTTNLNFKKQLKGSGREISADLDYIRYSSELNQNTDNTVAYPSIPSSVFLLRAVLPSEISIYSGKIDFTSPLTKKIKLEAGVKTSLVKIDNNAPYESFDRTQQKWVDDVRKDHFAYDEQIAAGYISMNSQIKKWGFQAGLRGEYTHSTGKQVLINKSISRNYFQLFPTAYVSYAMNDHNQFGLSYGRRIERPNYQDLNPFQRFLDMYTYNQGNPYLTPQFTNNIELSHIYKGKLSTTINYSNTTDIMNDVIKQNDETKIIFQTKENVASRRYAGISVSYNAPLNKWWTTSLYTNVYHNHFKGMVNNSLLSTDITSFVVNLNQQFKFAKTWGAEVSAYYQSKELMTSMFILDPIYVVSFGASKQILKNKGTIRLSITDPFELQKADVDIRHGNVNMFVTNRWYNRHIGISFTYRFNKGLAVQQSKRSGSAQDEQKRIGQ